MMPVEMGGGGGGGRGGGTAPGAAIDPSNLHLKKELTQIRKAAMVLRDPGTSSSSWRSHIDSARSLTKHHYVHHHKSGNEIISSSQQFLQSNGNSNNNNGVVASDNKCNVGSKEREKKVFLYNWRSQKSQSDKQIHDDLDDVENNSKDEESFSNDSKSDAYLSEKYNASDIFRCKETDFTPSIMRTVKKKQTRISYSNNHNEKLRKQIIMSSSLVDQSDDTEDYLNSEDLTSRASAISPLLARFKNKGRARAYQRKEDDSISYRVRNPSTVESWDATTGSLNGYADDEVDDQLGRQGCGIPCYWSKRSTPKSRVGYGSCSSPSLSETLRRKGSNIFCGTQSRRHLGSNKRRPSTRIPLLTSKGSSSDELSTNFGEIDLEALSRLDGRRWSSSCCRSQEGLEIVVHDENGSGSGSPENVRSLSHKYRPMFFDELIGQNLVVQSLKSVISRKRVMPVYLFQGPRGTGKTSAARVFAAALNCLSSEENKPCGVCRECGYYISGKTDHIVEVDGSNKNGIEKIKNVLKSLSAVRMTASSQFRVFVVDECHLLPSKTWMTLLRFLEKPLPRAVFVLITSDADNVPRTVLSRCQRHLFNKITNGDIFARLRKIGDDAGLGVEPDALEMIASNADGSLRDAETMLDQLSLFGKRISVSLVNELIGVVSDEKLLELLELAMSSNTTETVIRAREFMDLGVDPIVLMSQIATLIVDIIAGTYSSGDANHDSFFGGQNLSERELDRLKHALTLLSEAEKHLRVSGERSTWFTATLLQLGSGPSSSDRAHSGSSRRQSSKATEDGDHMSLKSFHRDSTSKDNNNNRISTSKDNNSSFDSNPSGPSDGKTGRPGALRCVNAETLGNIWLDCIEKCHSKTLRQLLHSHGRLVSITEVKGGFVAHIGFVDQTIKTRAEGFLSSITNSFEIVLRQNVEVKIIRMPDFFKNITTSPEKNKSPVVGTSGVQIGPSESANVGPSKSEIPAKRIKSIIREQRLETAWLQVMDRGTTPRSTSRLKPERNQVLPQDIGLNELEPLDEDELNREIKALKINDQIVAKRNDHCPISPSLLHNSSFASRDNMGYESGPGAAGCGAMFCWNSSRPEKSRTQAKQRTTLYGQKSGRFTWFGECAKSRRGNSRYSR